MKLMPPYFSKVAVWVVAKDIDSSVFKLPPLSCTQRQH
jgi:hypothetical protein